MSQSAYDVVAVIAKYWFILLILYILFRMVQSLYAEFRDDKRSKKDAHYAYMGYLEVMECHDAHLLGARFAFRRESYIGRSPRCDIRLKLHDLAPVECVLYKHGQRFYVGNINSKYGISVNDMELGGEDQPVEESSLIEMEGVALSVHFKEEDEE